MRNNLEQNDCVSVAQDEYNSLSVMHCRMTWQSPAANYMQQITHRFALLLIFPHPPPPPVFFPSTATVRHAPGQTLAV